MYDPGMAPTDTDTNTAAGSAALKWRPQGFGKSRAAAIDDPIVEPLWTGIRVLAHVDGDPVDDFPEINTALARAVRAERIVVDAHLTHQPIQAIAEVSARDSQGAEVPTATADLPSR